MAQQTLEEAADKYFQFAEKIGGETYSAYRVFITGAKWQQERMYTEEEVIEVMQFARTMTSENTYKAFDRLFKKR